MDACNAACEKETPNRPIITVWLTNGAVLRVEGATSVDEAELVLTFRDNGYKSIAKFAKAFVLGWLVNQ